MVIEVLVEKTIAAAVSEECRLITVSGGVSCNRGLRKAIELAAREKGIELLMATPGYSTDNAAMIAYAAACRQEAGFAPSDFAQDINPNLGLEAMAGE